MSKLVDKERLAQLAQALDRRAKDAVEDEKIRAMGVESGLQSSINAINNASTGILAKSKEYTNSEINKVKKTISDANSNISVLQDKTAELEGSISANASAISKEVTDRTKAVSDVNSAVTREKTRAEGEERKLSEAISAETARATSVEQSHTSAISKLNADENVEGSVAKKIKDAVTPISSELSDTQSSLETLQGEVTANKAAITAGDATTLSESKKYTDGRITSLIDGAPQAMDTLKELADAIASNKGTFDGYVATMTSQLGTKVDKKEGHRLIAESEITKFNNKAETSDVAKALSDAQSYTDGKISQVNSANGNAVARVEALEGIVGSANTNTGLVKEVNDIKAKNTAQDSAITSAQETADNAVANAATAQTQANKGVQDAATAKSRADKGVADAATAQQGVNALKATVGDSSSGLVKGVNTINSTLATMNHTTTGILATARKYTDTEVSKVKSSVSSLSSTVGTHTENIATNASNIANEISRAKGEEKKLTDAITTLNGADTVAGSVSKKIKDALSTYSNTEGVKTLLSSVVGSLALTMDGSKVKLKLGGVEGVTVSETTLDICSSEDIDAIVASLDRTTSSRR